MVASRCAKEVAGAGFDDIPLVADVTPALTSGSLPLAEMGARALELALADEPAGELPPVAAGERLALADAHGRVGKRRVRLVELDDSAPTGETWDPSTVEANARRATADPTTIAYLGELDLGGHVR